MRLASQIARYALLSAQYIVSFIAMAGALVAIGAASLAG